MTRPHNRFKKLFSSLYNIPPKYLNVIYVQGENSEKRWNLSGVINILEGMIAKGITFVVSQASMIITAVMIESPTVKIQKDKPREGWTEILRCSHP